MSNWNLDSFDNLYASLAESTYRDRPKNFPYEQLDQIQEERSKLKWEYDNEIDAFYKNQKKLESKPKKRVWDKKFSVTQKLEISNCGTLAFNFDSFSYCILEDYWP